MPLVHPPPDSTVDRKCFYIGQSGDNDDRSDSDYEPPESEANTRGDYSEANRWGTPDEANRGREEEDDMRSKYR